MFIVKNKMTIKKTKEQIIEALKGKSKTEILAQEYVEAENKLLKAFEELESWGSECNCDNRTIIEVIADGTEYPEIATYCLNCGGFVDGA